MIWDKNLERIEKYMDKQIDKQTENKMSRKDHIEVLRAMAIGRTEKETIEYAIKQIKSAKKWKRKYLEMRSIVDKAAEVLDFSDKNGLHLSYPAWLIANRLSKALEPYLLERLKGEPNDKS